MFIPYLRHSCLFFALFISASSTFADVYKWVDDEGQTHYSRQVPQNYQADIIKAPPPPAIDPAEAQKKTDALIKQQAADSAAKQENQGQQLSDAEQKEKQQENCRQAQYNLQQYQNNPHGRVLDDEGNATHMPEEERQANMTELQQYVNDFCQ